MRRYRHNTRRWRRLKRRHRWCWRHIRRRRYIRRRRHTAYTYDVLTIWCKRFVRPWLTSARSTMTTPTTLTSQSATISPFGGGGVTSSPDRRWRHHKKRWHHIRLVYNVPALLSRQIVTSLRTTTTSSGVVVGVDVDARRRRRRRRRQTAPTRHNRARMSTLNDDVIPGCRRRYRTTSPTCTNARSRRDT